MKNLTRKEAEKICDEIFDKKYTDEEIAEILICIAKKGETEEEIAGFSDSLLKHAEPFPYREDVFDICGTGGSTVERFNVSTVVAFILASLGVKVAKHGNRGSHRPNGSFDFLEELGINIDVDGYVLSECLEKTNLAFIFARKFHPAMKMVAKARKIVDHRTIFNLAGPISNPANIKKQVVGTADKNMVDLLVKTGRLIGREECLVVSGHPGIDEISVSGISIVGGSQTTIREITPEQIDTPRYDYDKIPCGDAKFNAQEFYKLINNSANNGLEDIVCVNAGLALAFFKKSNFIIEDIKDGIRESRDAIRLGWMRKKFEEYKKAVKGIK
ncbi:MAG: anthranilate phosphoribosyltransferase [Elusimicrobia bacterium]|nr:anthranilate phosphoribosyltransferase [Elusimicrobiota bacterium]